MNTRSNQHCVALLRKGKDTERFKEWGVLVGIAPKQMAPSQ